MAKDLILRDYQVSHANELIRILDNYNVAIDTSSTGTGKTYTALNVALSLKKKPFVICPKSVISMWRDLMESYGIDGIVINYATARLGKYYEKNAKGKWIRVNCPYINVENKKFSIDIPDDYIVILDEAHVTNNIRTLNSKLLRAIRSTWDSLFHISLPLLLLSATICYTPLKSGAIAVGVDNVDIYTYWTWISNFKCEKRELPFDANKKAWMCYDERGGIALIRQEYGKYMTGMDANTLIKLGLFPSSNVNVRKIPGGRGKQMSLLSTGMLDEKAAAEQKNTDAFIKHWRKSELRKIPYIVSKTVDYVKEEQKSVVIFVHFRNTAEILTAELGNHIRTALVDGAVASAGRESIIDAFQSNELHCIVATYSTMNLGISLHDVHKERERTTFLLPEFNMIQFIQALGRTQRSGGTYVYQELVFLSNEIDAKTHKSLSKKLLSLHTINNRAGVRV